jgi:hypothetical protein
MLISTALLLDSIIRNSVCTPAKLPCRRAGWRWDTINVDASSPICFIPLMKALWITWMLQNPISNNCFRFVVFLICSVSKRCTLTLTFGPSLETINNLFSGNFALSNTLVMCSKNFSEGARPKKKCFQMSNNNLIFERRPVPNCKL